MKRTAGGPDLLVRKPQLLSDELNACRDKRFSLQRRVGEGDRSRRIRKIHCEDCRQRGKRCENPQYSDDDEAALTGYSRN